MRVPESWMGVLGAELDAPYWHELPPEEQVFAALERTAPSDVRIVLVGQDPYPTPGHAHGLAFSVPSGVKPPGSLANIQRELLADLGVPIAPTGDLEPWAARGMLLLNTVLTVRAREPNSHKSRGWETFTDAVLRAVSARPRPAVFVLWGAAAKKKERLVDASRHRVVSGPHPSPLSIKHWRGSRPFSRIDAALASLGEPPFDWSLS